MKKFSASDSVYVTVYYMGAQVMRITLSGIDSQATLMRSLREKLGNYGSKLLTLETRNASQGWTHTMPVLFAA